MGRGELLTGLVDRIQDHAGVTQVYGDPIEREGKQVVPVAEIMYGFGGGADDGDADDTDADTSAEETSDGGIGMGGGVWARPAGVLEITDDDTRFVPHVGTRKLVVVSALAFALGYLLGRK